MATPEPKSDAEQSTPLSGGCGLLLALGAIGETIQFVWAKDTWLEWMDTAASWVGCPVWLVIAAYFLTVAGILGLFTWGIFDTGTNKPK